MYHVRNYIRDCTISLTQRCNLYCPYCFRDSGKESNSAELSFLEWKSVFLKLKKANVLRILLTGGEIFLRNDLYSILEELFNMQFQVSIATNGTIFNKDVIELLGRNSFAIGYVQVSLDGCCSEINDKTRGKGSFEKTIQFIKELKNRRVHVSCRITLNKFNVNSFVDLIHFVHDDLEIQDVSINEIQPVGRGINSDFTLTKDDRIQLIQNNIGLVSRLKFMNCEIGKLVGMIFHTNNVVGGKLQSCTKAFKGIHILQNGDIILCDMLPEIILGNVLNTDNLLKIWKENDVLENLRGRSEIQLDSFLKCQNCKFLTRCMGSCPVYDFQATRRIDSNSDSRCYKILYDEYSVLIDQFRSKENE